MYKENIDNIKNVILQSNKPVSQWARDIGVTRQTIYSWLNSDKPIKIRNRYLTRINNVLNHSQEAVKESAMNDNKDRMIESQAMNIKLLTEKLETLTAEQAFISKSETISSIETQYVNWAEELGQDLISLTSMYDSDQAFGSSVDGKFFKLNTAFKDLLGLDDSIIGQSLFSVVSNGNKKIIEAVVKRHKPFESFYVCLNHSKGFKVPVKIERWASKNSLGQSVSVVSITEALAVYRTWGGFNLDESGDMPIFLRWINSPLIEDEYGFNKENPLPPISELMHPDEIKDAFDYRASNIENFYRIKNSRDNNQRVFISHSDRRRITNAKGEWILSDIQIDLVEVDGKLQSRVYMTPYNS